MPLGSSSAAPVTRRSPRHWRKLAGFDDGTTGATAGEAPSVCLRIFEYAQHHLHRFEGQHPLAPAGEWAVIEEPTHLRPTNLTAHLSRPAEMMTLRLLPRRVALLLARSSARCSCEGLYLASTCLVPA